MQGARSTDYPAYLGLPPKKELYRYGGEMFAQFEDGSVHYQDAFGRTEKQHEILQKGAAPKPLRSKDLCGCGNGRIFGECCEGKPVELRPSWTERSIRVRNLMFLNALDNVLGLADEDTRPSNNGHSPQERLRQLCAMNGSHRLYQDNDDATLSNFLTGIRSVLGYGGSS